MLIIKGPTEKADYPDALVVKTSSFNLHGPKYLRFILMTADNKPSPYYLIQIFEDEKQSLYSLNYAINPGPNTIESLKEKVCTSLDVILSALHLAMQQGQTVFDIPDGQPYLDYITQCKELLERVAGNELDAALRSWMGWK